MLTASCLFLKQIPGKRKDPVTSGYYPYPWSLTEQHHGPTPSSTVRHSVIQRILTASWANSLTERSPGFPCGSAGEASACSAGDLGSIPGSGRFLGGGNGLPLLYSGLENSMDCLVHGVAESKSQTRPRDFHCCFWDKHWEQEVHGVPPTWSRRYQHHLEP